MVRMVSVEMCSDSYVSVLILGCGSNNSLVAGRNIAHSVGESSRKAESRLSGDYSNLSEGGVLRRY